MHQTIHHRCSTPLLVLEMMVQRNGRAVGSQAPSLQTPWVWFHDSKCSHYCGLISYHPSAELWQLSVHIQLTHPNCKMCNSPTFRRPVQCTLISSYPLACLRLKVPFRHTLIKMNHGRRYDEHWACLLGGDSQLSWPCGSWTPTMVTSP